MTLDSGRGAGLSGLAGSDEKPPVLEKLRLHTRVVLALTAFLVLVPAALFFYHGERGHGGHADRHARLGSLFSAVTPRTAGFDTVPTGELSPAGGMLTLLLMLTGGNSGSTAGGAKATTLLLVVLTAVSILRGEEDVHIFGRRIETTCCAAPAPLSWCI